MAINPEATYVKASYAIHRASLLKRSGFLFRLQATCATTRSWVVWWLVCDAESSNTARNVDRRELFHVR